MTLVALCVACRRGACAGQEHGAKLEWPHLRLTWACASASGQFPCGTRMHNVLSECLLSLCSAWAGKRLFVHTSVALYMLQIACTPAQGLVAAKTNDGLSSFDRGGINCVNANPAPNFTYSERGCVKIRFEGLCIRPLYLANTTANPLLPPTLCSHQQRRADVVVGP
jgi:hypothetical protein